MTRLFIAYAHVLFLYVVLLKAQLPENVTDRMKQKEDIVNELADLVVELFEDRKEYLGRCECSTHACTSNVSSFNCTSKLGSLPDVCEEYCEEALISFNSSVVRTPPNTDLRNVSAHLKESICLYSNLEPLMKNLTSPQNPNWLYFAGVDGSFRIYPGAALPRDMQNGDQLLGGCKRYDPRITPWFVGAITRPRGIVFLIDTSGSMNERMSEDSSIKRIQAIKASLKSILDTMSSFDYINIIRFSDSAERLVTQSPLLQGTEENLKLLKSRVDDLRAGNKTNFTAAFDEAFDVLKNFSRNSTDPTTGLSCRKLIFFLTDGRDTTASKSEGIEPSDMLRFIEDRQQELNSITSYRAKIFTYSLGDSADDSIPRQIACANDGFWFYVAPGEDPFTAMSLYFHFLPKTGNNTPIWINPYEDDYGSGAITTVAKAVYSKSRDSSTEVLLGVVGHDVRLTELNQTDVSLNDVLKELTRRSQGYDRDPQSLCQLQVHRNAYADHAACVDPILEFPNHTGKVERSGGEYCYRFSRKYYKLFTEEKVEWITASQHCDTDGGRLVTISNDEELAFVAGLSSPDGSWIGARKDELTPAIKWIDSRISSRNLDHESDWWGLGEPNDYLEKEDCVHIDRRGPKGNLNDEHCDMKLSFVCEYTESTPCHRIVKRPEDGYFSIPPLSKCTVEQKVLDEAKPLSESDKLVERDVVCPLGEQKDTVDVSCCPFCVNNENGAEIPSLNLTLAPLVLSCLVCLLSAAFIVG